MCLGLYKYIEQTYGNILYSRMYYIASVNRVATGAHNKQHAKAILLHSIQWDYSGLAAGTTINFTDNNGIVLLSQDSGAVQNPGYVIQSIPYIIETDTIKITASATFKTPFIVGYQYLYQYQNDKNR